MTVETTIVATEWSDVEYCFHIAKLPHGISSFFCRSLSEKSDENCAMSQRNESTTLGEACAAGDIDSVRKILDSGADVEGSSATDTPPIVSAAHGGHVAIVQELLKRGASITGVDLAGVTALEAAVSAGHKDVAKVLLPGSVATTARNGDASVLHWLAKRGHSAAVTLLLQAKANPLQVDEDDEQATDWAADSGHAEVAALLREAAQVEERAPQPAQTTLILPDVGSLLSSSAHTQFRQQSEEAP